MLRFMRKSKGGSDSCNIIVLDFYELYPRVAELLPFSILMIVLLVLGKELEPLSSPLPLEHIMGG